jgi:hypothetical protein
MNWLYISRRRRSARNRQHERVMGMKAEHWTQLKVSGIYPLTIDRVEGTYQVEFDRTGKSLPIYEYKTVWVKAFQARHPDGRTQRFATLKDAKAYAMQQLRVGQ